MAVDPLNIIQSGAHTGHWSKTVDVAGTYEFKTGGKYVDKNIDVVVPKAVETVSATASVDVSDTITSLTVGEPTTENGYPVTASKTIAKTITGTATASVSTRGFTNDTSYTGSTSGTTSGSFSVEAYLLAGAITVDASATVTPQTATKNTNSNVSTGTIVTSEPTSGYYLGVDSKTNAKEITFDSNISTSGYVSSLSQVNPAGTVTGGTTTTYIPITSSSTGTSASGTKVSTVTPGASAKNVNITEGYTPARYWQVGAVTLDIAKGITGTGSIGVSASDPGATYTANTDAVIPSDSTNGPGYLTLSAGYYPATKISLSTLVPDGANIGDTKGVGTILTGTTVYDKHGNLLTGTMANNGATGDTITTQGGTYTIPAGYTTGGTVTASLSEMTLPTAANTTAGSETSKATVGRSTSTQYIHIPVGYNATAAKYTISATPNVGTATTVPTAVTTEVSVGTTASSGYYNVTNTVGAKVTYASAGWVATTGSTGSASVQVGKIKQSTSSATVGSTLAAGSTLTIGAGYYPTDRTYETPTASGSVGTTTVETGLTGNTITSGYTAPTLKESSDGLEAYVTLNATASGETGKVVSSITSPTTRYIEVYTGTYSVS